MLAPFRLHGQSRPFFVFPIKRPGTFETMNQFEWLSCKAGDSDFAKFAIAYRASDEEGAFGADPVKRQGAPMFRQPWQHKNAAVPTLDQ